MVAPDSNQPVSLADLMETAVSAAHPGRVSRKIEDHIDYRLPFERIDGRLDQEKALGGISWSPALRSAYEDGYDPLLWIGRGAFSEVWRCVDRSFGREVAIKVPFHDQGKDSGAVVAALQSEAELLGRLHHPGVVHAVRRSGEGRDAYLALDFVDGEDLIEHCRLQKMSCAERLRLFEKVLDAAAYLHSKDIVHGDLKPEHILVRENDQPVLIDFGLSSYDSSSLRLSDARRIGGSGRFRAPEIANGSAVSPEPQQDIYSLGVILRELLDSAAEGGEVESIFRRVVDRAVLSESDKRWRDAGAMLEALRSCQTPRLASDPPASTVATPPQNSRSRYGLRWVVSLGTIAALVIVGLLLFIQSDARDPADAPESAPHGRRSPAQASLLDLALQDFYAGNAVRAGERLEQASEQDPGRSSAWETRHIEAVGGGRGHAHPLGQTPFGASHALGVDYDPTSQTVAYVTRQQGRYELWVRPINGPARRFGASNETVRAIAISPGAERVATVDLRGNVVVWTLQDGGDAVLQSHALPRQADDRSLWFSADGRSLFLFSPRNRAVECWPVQSPLPARPSFVIGDCDHAYRLASGRGVLMVATAGERTRNGLTQLRTINQAGQVVRQLELTDGLLPTSADSGPGQDATVCLGMPNGFVRIHRARGGGWQEPCDLGLNEAIPAIVYSEREQRAFAGLGRIHLVTSGGELIMRLGDRNDPQRLITRLDFDDDTLSLTCVSIREFWRCLAD